MEIKSLITWKKENWGFFIRTLRWVKLFPLTVLYYSFFHSANLLAVLKLCLYVLS